VDSLASPSPSFSSEIESDRNKVFIRPLSTTKHPKRTARSHTHRPLMSLMLRTTADMGPRGEESGMVASKVAWQDFTAIPEPSHVVRVMRGVPTAFRLPLVSPKICAQVIQIRHLPVPSSV